MDLFKLLLLVVSLIFTSSYSQEKFIGKVKDFDGKAVTDGVVYVNNNKTEVMTNKRGYFELELPKDTKMISILSPTYGLLNAEYNNQKSLSFVYVNTNYKADKATTQNSEDTSDKISIGYGTVDKENSLFDDAEIEIEAKDNPNAFTSIYDLIRARVKGVRVTGNRIVIRGVNSFGSNTDPLFVVNGQVVQDISYVVPAEVKSINVLKGAAASIYGTRAANGVIEITLKS